MSRGWRRSMRSLELSGNSERVLILKNIRKFTEFSGTRKFPYFSYEIKYKMFHNFPGIFEFEGKVCNCIQENKLRIFRYFCCRKFSAKNGLTFLKSISSSFNPVLENKIIHFYLSFTFLINHLMKINLRNITLQNFFEITDIRSRFQIFLV